MKPPLKLNCFINGHNWHLCSFYPGCPDDGIFARVVLMCKRCRKIQTRKLNWYYSKFDFPEEWTYQK